MIELATMEDLQAVKKLQYTQLKKGADIDTLEPGGYFVNWHDNTNGKYPFTGTGILIQFDSITKFQIAMYDSSSGIFFVRSRPENREGWGAWYKNESHSHPNKDVLDNITGYIQEATVKKGTLSDVDIRTVSEAGIYRVENDCTGMPTEINNSATFGMTLIVMPRDSKSTDLHYNQYLFVNGYGTDEVNSLFVNQIFSQNGSVIEELKWTKIASSDLQSQLDEIKNAANHPNKNVLNAIDEHKINLWDNGVEILNNHKFYTQSLTESLLEDMIIFYKNADWCAGVYMFIPESNVEKIHLENQDGDIAYSISGTFEIGYIYIIRFGETSEIISKVPFEPVNRVEVQDIIKASELKWQPLNGEDGETVIEDVKAYTYTLPEKCKGIIVDISVPKAENWPGGLFSILDDKNVTVAQSYTWKTDGATENKKTLRVCCKPENGYYDMFYNHNTGTNEQMLTQYRTSTIYVNKVADTACLKKFTTVNVLPVGTIIKVWGLIEE